MPVKRTAAHVPENLKQLERILLDNRGITDSAAFFQPPHPALLHEAETGIVPAQLLAVTERLEHARSSHEDVVIFGDYDADGVCATAILWEALFSLGIRARPFIPDRFNHGYGLTVKAVKALVEKSRPDLIITVDNGIVAYEALAFAKNLGIFTIVTDHHQPDKQLLPADLLLHSTKLSGSGVAWMLAHELAPTVAANSLELAGLATIADQVPLLGANRSVAWHGLAALRSTTRVGLLELYAVAGIEKAKITEKTVGFGIAPRINAMGRLASAVDALRLLCTTSPVRAQNLAKILQDKNLERQQLTTDLLAVAKLQVASQKDASVLIVHSTEFHEGVIGLIAGRLVEEHQKPAIVIAMGEGVGKGSARSTPQVNIVELLRSVREHLLELGGHPMAAGFNILEEKLESFTRAAQTKVSQIMEKQPGKIEVEVECQLPHSLVSLETAEYLEKYAPFGAANHHPVFEIQNVECLQTQLVGKQANHRKYTFKIGENFVSGVSWYNPNKLAEVNTANLTVIASLAVEEWRGKTLILTVKSIHS